MPNDTQKAQDDADVKDTVTDAAHDVKNTVTDAAHDVKN